jgi:putative chitinase
MNKTFFFDTIRDSLYKGKMSASHVAGCEAILEACAGWPVNWTAYAFATAYHETAFTMQPIRERGSDAYLTNLYDVTGKNPKRAKSMGNTTPGDGAKYCGRGYVQLTWKKNYRKLGVLLDRDLVNTPDLAMRPEIAAQIMRYGMRDGLFTGKKLGDYLTASKSDYVNARRIINGTDKAKQIASYATAFEAALRAAGYGAAEKPATTAKPAKATPVAARPVSPQPDDPGVDAADVDSGVEKPGWFEVQVLRPLGTVAVMLGLTWEQLLSADPKSLQTIGMFIVLGIALWALTDQGRRWIKKRAG